MKILGIDEAGRGPVIGPLVMCGYLIDGKKLLELRELGVKDSKLLSEKTREKMEKKLKKIADDFILFSIPANEIDRLRTVMNLNRLEIEKMQEIINLLEPDVAIVDAIERNTKRFSKKLLAGIDNGVKLVAENFADKNHPEVSAASIMAKVHRDNEIEKLHKKYGFFGSGYSSDERTIKFLKDYIKMNKELPGFIRKSWMTIQLIKEENEQSKLMKFFANKNLDGFR